MRLKKHIPKIIIAVALLFAFVFIAFHHGSPSPHEQMIQMLRSLEKRNTDLENPFNPESKLAHVDTLLKLPGNGKNIYSLSAKAALLLKTGQEQLSVNIYENLMN